MFGNMMGDMEKRQEELRAQLAETFITEEAAGGALRIEVNALREITNISIRKELLDPEDPEQLEDLLLVSLNRALSKAAEKEATESQKLLKDMLPPGLDGLF
jgi:DNA-binding YbaB/EbfC family protein